MAGFFDRNAVVVLKYGWGLLAADSDLFLANVQDLTLTDAMVTEMHGVLCPSGNPDHVQIVTTQSARRQGLYWVSVKQEPELPARTPLGHAASPTAEDDVRLRFETEQVTVVCHTPHPDLTRALSAALGNVMVANYAALHRAGYQGLAFIRGLTLSPAEEAHPAGSGATKIYRHARTWRTESQAEARLPSSATINSVLAAPIDVSVGGVSGGIDPAE